MKNPYKPFIAIDQYGKHYFVTYPRKELCEIVGVKHADKMYRDGDNGQIQHVGYIISGHWFEVMRIEPFKS
jgi:hypothetical protein